MTIVLKSQLRDEWQYTGQPPHTFPAWVRARTRMVGDDLLLVRRSGDQLVKASEWLLRDPDSRETEWLTDAMYRRDYCKVTT